MTCSASSLCIIQECNWTLHFSALEALVNFAYTGKVVLDKNNVQSIMIGASYLQLNKVRDACANYLLQRCDEINISFNLGED